MKLLRTIFIAFLIIASAGSAFVFFHVEQNPIHIVFTFGFGVAAFIVFNDKGDV